MILAGLLEDVRLDAAYQQVPWAVQRRPGIPSALTYGALVEPLHAEHRSLSLAGELGLAMFMRLMGARESVICLSPACGRVEVFEDVRHRRICSLPECRAWYRRTWMRDPANLKVVKRAKAKKGTRR